MLMVTTWTKKMWADFNVVSGCFMVIQLLFSLFLLCWFLSANFPTLWLLDVVRKQLGGVWMCHTHRHTQTYQQETSRERGLGVEAPPPHNRPQHITSKETFSLNPSCFFISLSLSIYIYPNALLLVIILCALVISKIISKIDKKMDNKNTFLGPSQGLHHYAVFRVTEVFSKILQTALFCASVLVRKEHYTIGLLRFVNTPEEKTHIHTQCFIIVDQTHRHEQTKFY